MTERKAEGRAGEALAPEIPLDPGVGGVGLPTVSEHRTLGSEAPGFPH